LTLHASQQKFGSWSGVAAQADDQGRFRINPYPGIRFRLIAYPPDGAPYLIRQNEEFDWQPGRLSMAADITLPRGALVRGKVFDKKTGAPIANASLQYMPGAGNLLKRDDIITGWQGIEVSGTDGRFSISVLPGSGWLLIHAPTSEYVLQEIGSREIYRGTPGGTRYYAHAIEKISAKSGEEPLELSIGLTPGVTVEGRVVAVDGQPAENAQFVSRLNILAINPTWRGFPVGSASGGRFKLTGCAPGVRYPAYFFDPDQKIGTAVDLGVSDADNKDLVVQLAPFGSAKARFVDAQGKPNMNPSLFIVMTPGAPRFSRDKGQLEADYDFVANVDRKNHGEGRRPDKDGWVTFKALIPGATYRLEGPTVDGDDHVLKDFTVEPGQELNLGDIVTP
jgi:hypothetical protein